MGSTHEVRYELPEAGVVSRCRSCGCGIAWIKTPKGANMPIDLQTSRTEPDGHVTYASHFGTCPQAKDWSKKGKNR